MTAFAELMRSVRACQSCAPALPVAPRPVVQAHPSARILLASQAPGRIVHDTGVPFNDKSGERLRDWLGVDAPQFYDERLFAIVPMGFCYPGSGKSGDLPPRPECARQWRRPLLEQLRRVELVVAIGQYAVTYHTGGKRPLRESIADWKKWLPELIPLPHPSPRNAHWVRQNPHFEHEVLPELRRRIQDLIR